MTMLLCSNTAPMSSPTLDDFKGLYTGHIHSAVLLYIQVSWFTAVSKGHRSEGAQYATALIFLTKLVYYFLRIRLDPAVWTLTSKANLPAILAHGLQLELTLC
jgi:hypothetical protein